MKLTDCKGLSETIGKNGSVLLVCDRDWFEDEVATRVKNNEIFSTNLQRIKIVTSALPCEEVSKIESENVFEREWQIWYDKYDRSKEMATITEIIDDINNGICEYRYVRDELIDKISDFIISKGYYDFEKRHITSIMI